ncbi:hypothetical protein SAMN02927937_00664 [Paenimyroides aquimaris]|uniref:Uncharacterized protein n=1 Tax=Paenimyroides marinum TaxID=1159016 RepID=A0A1H6JPH5_9FLAO|nr:hypothetical protein [Paenimyroides aquimaris]SEH64372.1 hypothetical protein SAMN02927937_00664 [Paenimyroides aquimaris]
MEENISKTEFSNVSEAIYMWHNVVHLKDVEHKKFPGVVDFFKNAEITLVDYVAENYYFPINVVNSTCREDLLDCTKRATRNYQSDIKAALTISDENSQRIAVAQADQTMLQEMEICGGTYDLCIQN